MCLDRTQANNRKAKMAPASLCTRHSSLGIVKQFQLNDNVGSLVNNFILHNCSKKETENFLLTLRKISFAKVGFSDSFKRAECTLSSSATGHRVAG